MRRIEKEQGRQASQIVAVTALSSEEHRSRGLNEYVPSSNLAEILAVWSWSLTIALVPPYNSVCLNSTWTRT